MSPQSAMAPHMGIRLVMALLFSGRSAWLWRSENSRKRRGQRRVVIKLTSRSPISTDDQLLQVEAEELAAAQAKADDIKRRKQVQKPRTEIATHVAYLCHS